MVTSIEGPPLDIPAPPPPKPPAPPKVKVQPPPPPVVQPAPKPNVAKFFAPKIEPPKPKPRDIQAELPKVNDTFQPVKLEMASNQPARPREPVKTGMMTSGSSAVPTIENKPIDKVQTGGFGDPNGVAGPSGPEQASQCRSIWQPSASSSWPGLRQRYGWCQRRARGSRQHGIRQRCRDSSVRRPAPQQRGTASTGFANQNDQVIEAPKKKADDAQAVESVVILAKPKPVYSAEALKLNLEGEVLLDVVFPASGGEVHVNRVVKGLGHGLDEAAMRAAQEIKYKPAMSNGHPVDFPAVIHIVFQMAY